VIAAGAMPYRKLFDTTYIAPGALRLRESGKGPLFR
jgi:hypothetical protein